MSGFSPQLPSFVVVVVVIVLGVSMSLLCGVGSVCPEGISQNNTICGGKTSPSPPPSPSDPPPAKSKYRSTHDLHQHVTGLWNSITVCFRSRYTRPFDSHLLSLLSPLLVVTMSSGGQDLVNITLNFWSSTFDKVDHLTYPDKLR